MVGDKYTVTIGIPAYNEEANIKVLLADIQKQVCINYHLEKIIVVSDGSNDMTVYSARQMDDDKILVIDSKERKGVASRQNEIIEQTNSDVLIILNADINIQDTLFIENIIKPVTKGVADLVTPELKQVEPTTYFEKILYASMQLKKTIYESYKEGNNVYTCAGPARAFSKKLYKMLRFKESSNEDAYSYLFAVKHGFKYEHTHETAVYFRLPSNFSDHKKQSSRFFQSQNGLVKEFGKQFIEKNYALPFKNTLSIVTNQFIKNPVKLSLYALILGYILCFSPKEDLNRQVWDSSTSSKNLQA